MSVPFMPFLPALPLPRMRPRRAEKTAPAPANPIDPARLDQALRLMDAAPPLAAPSVRARRPWRAVLLADPMAGGTLHVRWVLEDVRGARYDPPFALHHAAVHILAPQTDIRWASVRHSDRPTLVRSFPLRVAEGAHVRLAAQTRLDEAHDLLARLGVDIPAEAAAFAETSRRFARVHGFAGPMEICA